MVLCKAKKKCELYCLKGIVRHSQARKSLGSQKFSSLLPKTFGKMYPPIESVCCNDNFNLRILNLDIKTGYWVITWLLICGHLLFKNVKNWSVDFLLKIIVHFFKKCFNEIKCSFCFPCVKEQIYFHLRFPRKKPRELKR